MPASDGPMMRLKLNWAELSAMAFIRSSLPTRSVMNDCQAGPLKAIATPISSDSASRCQTVTRLRTTSTASSSISASSTACVTNRTRRRLRWSATTPAGSDSSSTGSVWAKEIRPSRKAEPVSSSTSQPSAIVRIHEPILATSAPVQKSR
jgi:hypothetical protein